MLRGFITFKCTRCGNKFISFDFEYMASVLSMPMKCPKCGSIRTKPSYSSDKEYLPIWEQMGNDIYFLL